LIMEHRSGCWAGGAPSGRPGTALVDAELAAALRADGGHRLRHRRPAAVRGHHHLRSWALRPRE